MWYQYLNRNQPYLKNYRKWNMWYDHNNPKHYEILRQRSTFFEHIIRRICGHDIHMRFFMVFCMLPLFGYLLKQRKRFTYKKVDEDISLSSAQLVANAGRNKYGFESRGTKSFEHAMGILISKSVFSNTLEGGKDPLIGEEIIDEDAGLESDMSEEDLLSVLKSEMHEPHLGIVFRHPHKHHLNEAPNDFLSPYKVVGEDAQHKHNSHH